MTPEQMAALLQPYNRLGREHSAIEGTGIGLVIGRCLADLMGGALKVASVAGEGSVFMLRLTSAVTGAPAPRPGVHEASALHGSRLVHHIADKETNVEVMRGILSRRPDLILLDMHPPDIRGLGLLCHIEQEDDVADIPVPVLSADAATARMQEALKQGAGHCLTKPMDIAAFLETLGAALHDMETRWGA